MAKQEIAIVQLPLGDVVGTLVGPPGSVNVALDVPGMVVRLVMTAGRARELAVDLLCVAELVDELPDHQAVNA